MRTLNLTFALGLFAVLIGMGTGTFFLHRYQLARISRDLKSQANQAQKLGQLSEAITHAYRYLEFQPKDVEMTEQLVDWLEKTSDGRPPIAELVRLLDQVLRIQPERDDLRRRLVAMELRLGQYGDCLDHLDRLLQVAPNDAELLRWLGECKVRTGRHSEAARAFEKAIQADPKQAASHIKLASLMARQLGRTDEARRILEETVQALPTDASLRLALARLLRQVGNTSMAKTSANVAVSLAPKDGAVLAFAGDLNQIDGDLTSARVLYQRACEVEPKNNKYQCTLIWLMLCDGQVPAATERLMIVLRDDPTHVDAIVLLGDVGVSSGKPDLLGKMIEEFGHKSDSGTRWVGDYLRARLSMYRGAIEDALAKLEQLRVTLAKNPGLVRHATYLIAQCHEQLGDRTAEVNAYRTLVEAEPGFGYYRIQFARALARAGQFDKAASEFRAAVESAELPANSVRATTVELVERCQRGGADHVLADLERAFAHVKADDESANAVVAKVELLRLRRRNEESLRLADAFLQRHPNHATMHATRIRVIEAMQDYEKVLAAGAIADSQCEGNVEIKTALMGVRARHGDWEKTYGYGIRFPNHETDPSKANDRVQELMEFIAGDGMSEHYPTSLSSLLELCRARPEYTGVRAVLLTLQLRSGEQNEINQLLAEISEIEGPNGWTSRRFRAEQLVSWADRDADAAGQARDALVVLAKERPREPIVLFLMGRLDEIENRESAVDHYRSALDYGLLDQPVEGHFWALPRMTSNTKVRFLLDSPLVERLRFEQDRAIIRPIIAVAVATGRPDVADRFLAAHRDATGPQLNWIGRVFQQYGLNAQAELAFTTAAQSNRGQQAKNQTPTR